uniref:Ig-like domain-containing protein n=1 Tax=Poecilia mexicana TaxID=48701 RepID=A0A3B3XCX7_9TELE
MDLWFRSVRICWWRVLLLMSVFQDYLSSMLDCPPTCSCSQTEIYCNKSDNGRFFPLLALQDGNGTGVDIADLFKNITSIHLENWTGLQTLRDVDMELYTGLQRLTIMNCNLRVIQPRAFAQNPHLRYINLSKNPLTTLSWQLFQHLQLSELRLDGVVFDCGCSIRWIQLWQEKGEAGLHTQQLYCMNGASKIRLNNMHINSCDLPEISVSHSSVLVTEGENVTVSCNGSRLPLPEVDWTVGDLHSINTHLSNVYWPDIHSINLTLFNISRDDNNFQLTCIAENLVGMTNSSIQLNVQFPPVILRLAEPEKRHDTCIEFTVRGYPYPKLRWFHKQTEIKENDFIWTDKDTYQDYLEGCLLFKNPTHLNNGNYTLEASNHLGTVTKTVYGHFLNDEAEIGEWTTFFFFFTQNVTIAVGLAGFACVLLLVLFVLINKYGRRSKFGMKGESAQLAGQGREAQKAAPLAFQNQPIRTSSGVFVLSITLVLTPTSLPSSATLELVHHNVTCHKC